MKKRRGAKKTSKTTKSHRRIKSFSNKKFLTISIIAFFVFALLLLFVNVPKASITGYQPKIVPGEEAKSYIRELFGKMGGEQLDVNVGKYVIWFTMFAIILALLNVLNFPGKGEGGVFIRVLISLGLGFLSTAYLIPEAVYTIIMSLETGAMMLTALPFIGIVVVSAMLLSVEKASEMSVWRVLGQLFLWILWVAFLIWRIIRAWADKGFDFLLKGGGVVLLFIMVPSVIILMFNKYFREWLRRLGSEIISARQRSMAEAEAARERGREILHKEMERFEHR